MHYFEYATKDTTLYQGRATSSQNTGLDEILEVRKDMNDTGTQINVSRVLIKFDLNYISSSYASGLIPTNAEYYLNYTMLIQKNWGRVMYYMRIQ